MPAQHMMEYMGIGEGCSCMFGLRERFGMTVATNERVALRANRAGCVYLLETALESSLCFHLTLLTYGKA